MAPSQHLRLRMGRTGTAGVALPIALVLGAALALSGCGAQQSGAAAIVNDTVISEQDVQTVTGEVSRINKDGQGLSASDALLSLILAPYVEDEATLAHKTVSEAEARKILAKVVAKPSPPTIRFVQMQLAVQKLDDANKTAIVSKLGKAKITVNPRYGTFDRKQFVIAATTPNWIKPSRPSVDPNSNPPVPAK